MSSIVIVNDEKLKPTITLYTIQYIRKDIKVQQTHLICTEFVLQINFCKATLSREAYYKQVNAVCVCACVCDTHTS